MSLELIEWAGAFLAILGTIFLSFKITTIKTTWGLWILSNIALAIVFIRNEQYGLVILQTGLLLISVLGMLGLKFKDNQKITQALYMTMYLSAILVIASIVQNFFYGLNIVLTVEWVGAFITLGANALMSTQNKHHHYAWPLWVFGNILLVGLSIHNDQMGFLALQASFLLLNIVGLCNHFIKKLPLTNQREVQASI